MKHTTEPIHIIIRQRKNSSLNRPRYIHTAVGSRYFGSVSLFNIPLFRGHSICIRVKGHHFIKASRCKNIPSRKVGSTAKNIALKNWRKKATTWMENTVQMICTWAVLIIPNPNPKISTHFNKYKCKLDPSSFAISPLPDAPSSLSDIYLSQHPKPYIYVHHLRLPKKWNYTDIQLYVVNFRGGGV